MKNIDKNIEKEIIDFYLNQKHPNLIKVGKHFGFGRPLIKAVLIRNCIPIKKNIRERRSHIFNIDYFETINTPDKAYFLGLIVADGCNTGKALNLSLHEKDIHILNLFLKYIESNSSPKPLPKSVGNQYLIDFCSSKVVEDLNKLGVVKAKTHKTYYPNIPENLWNHFIRGVFDGDGSISMNKKGKFVFNIIGNNLLIEKIQEILMKECNLKKTKLMTRIATTPNIMILYYGGNVQLKRIYSYLYKNCSDLFLIRKKNIFEELNKRTPYTNY